MNFKDYKTLPILITVIAGLILIAAAQIRNDQAFLLGVFLGYVMCLSNILFLLKILVKIFDENYKRPSIIALLFIAKLSSIGLLFYLAFGLFSVDMIGFMLGYSSIIPSVLIFVLIKNSNTGKAV